MQWQQYLSTIDPRLLVFTAGAMFFGVAFFVGRLLLGSQPEPIEEKVLPPDPESKTQERRSALRRGGSTVEVDIQIPNNDTILTGYVINRSIGGLGLTLHCELSKGSVIKIRPRTTTKMATWTSATVRSCRDDGHHYEIGVQFHHTPDWGQMLQFG